MTNNPPSQQLIKEVAANIVVPLVQLATTGRRASDSKYRLLDNLYFHRLLRISPIGPNQWDHVVGKHICVFQTGRDGESIYMKLTSHNRIKIPTGDPITPTDLRLTKRIKCAIGYKAKLNDRVGEFDTSTSDNEAETKV